MLDIKITNKCKKDLKAYKHRQSVISEFNDVVIMLRNQTPLPEKYKDHPLKGEYSGERDCHVKPNDILTLRKILKY